MVALLGTCGVVTIGAALVITIDGFLRQTTNTLQMVSHCHGEEIIAVASLYLAVIKSQLKSGEMYVQTWVFKLRVPTAAHRIGPASDAVIRALPANSPLLKRVTL